MSIDSVIDHVESTLEELIVEIRASLTEKRLDDIVRYAEALADIAAAHSELAGEEQ